MPMGMPIICWKTREDQENVDVFFGVRVLQIRVFLYTIGSSAT